VERRDQLLAIAVRPAGSFRLAVPALLAGAVRRAAGLAGVGFGAGALAIATGPGRFTTYAGSSAAGAIFTLCAGLGLIAAGLATNPGRRSGRTGDLALLAGFTWFAPTWAAWQDGPPLIPTLAAVLSGLTFPLVLHLVLTHPEGRARSTPTRVLAAVVYAEAFLTAALLALFRDPYADPGCLANCNVNMFLVRSEPSLTRALEVFDRWFTAAAAATLIAVCAARLARASPPARSRLLPVAVPAIGFAATAAMRAAELQRVTVDDPFNAALFTIFAAGSVAVTLLAAGLIFATVRTRAERRAVARVAANLDQAPAPGTLQTALATALRDPGLMFAYWLPAQHRYVDASGLAVPEPTTAGGRAVTRLTRNGRPIAAISHSAADPGIETRIGPAIRLGLENERLQAELLAQLGELRASRARVVEAADAERRRLERDLHDGAQQHLLALSYNIRLGLATARADGDAAAELALAEAAVHTDAALEELRELAHGIYPAILAEAGLEPALATLADTAPLPVDILADASGRYPATAEAAAYFAVAEALDDAARRGADHATVSVTDEDGQLAVIVECNGQGPVSPLTAAADRVGALGGVLSAGPTGCRLEIPCASL